MKNNKNFIKYCNNNLQPQTTIVRNGGGGGTCIGSTGPTGPTGATGTTGLSAYELAVQNGFIGTEQEWLLSLQGATGPQSISGSIIPYNAYGFELTYDYNQSVEEFNIYSIPFGAEGSIFYSTSFPYNLSSFSDQGESVIGFTVSADSTITAISGEFMGAVNTSTNDEYSVHAALYESAPMSSMFTYIPESDLQLSPAFNDEQQMFISSGIKNFEYTVAAGSKIALFIYLIANNPTQDGITADASGQFFGGITIREN